MKKVISLAMCAVIMLSTLSAAAYADSSEVMPVIFLNGFSGSSLYTDDENIFPPDFDGLEKDEIVKIVAALILGLVTGNYSSFAKIAAQAIPEVLEDFEKVTINPDGSSDYSISVYSQSPILMQGRAHGETERAIASEIGYDNCFQFYHDWRLSLVDTAVQLDTFIGGVLKLTGARSVALFGYSQGGQLATTYLKYFADKNEVGRIVFVNSPIAGTVAATAALDENYLDIGVYSLAQLAGFILDYEGDFEQIARRISLKFLNNAIMAVAKEYIYPIALYWGGVWDMVPLEDYERLKTEHLDSEEQAWLIAKSDEYHYEVMAKTKDILTTAQENGVLISAYSATQSGNVLSSSVNGDGVVDVHGSSGAYALKMDERFPQGYTPLGTSCSDPSHDHISPDMSFDASSAFLPENTWYVIGQCHCQYDSDEYTKQLLVKLFTTDELTDVYADSNFPQFRYGTAPYNDFYISFGGKNAGYIESGDTEVTVTNLSKEYAVNLSSVRLAGTSCKVNVPFPTVIKPGMSVTLTLNGSVSPGTRTAVDVVVKYGRYEDKLYIPRSKTFTYSAVG